jgi:cytochrome c-type biogenesis protein
MIDPIAAAMEAVTSGSPAALGLVFLAGVVSSIGPCVAPRYVAIAAIANGNRRPFLPTLAFVAGLIGAFMALGYVAGLLGTLWYWSSTIDAVLAVGLIGGGCIALVRAEAHHNTQHSCAGSSARPARHRSLGAIFLLGAASAFVISPCCTPVVMTVAATLTAIGKPLAGVVLLASFAAGHALPLFFAGSVGTLVRRIVPLRVPAQAPAIVGAVLMLALGIYYGVLA